MANSVGDYLSHSKLLFRYLKNYGLSKTLKAFYYYNYRLLKLKNLDKDSEQIVNVNGYKLNVIPDDPGISSELRIFNVHEPITTEKILDILKEGMVCLDIGSNIGYYALLESKAVGNSGKVISVEPSPRNFSYLKNNLESEKVTNVEVYNLAIGDKDGEVDFAVSDRSNLGYVITDDQNSQNSSTDQVPNKPNTIKTMNVIKVPMKRIDSFLEEKKLDRLDFVRMDIEGFEIKLFEGFWDSIRKYKPIIQMEFHNYLFDKETKTKFFQKLKEYGYEIKYFMSRDLDRPITGKSKDMKKISIDEMVKMFDKGPHYGGIMLFLENIH